MKKNWLIGVFIALSLCLSIIAICLQLKSIECSDISIVLGFVGILATFVVVNNAVQVWRVEDKMEQQQERIKDFEKQEQRQYNLGKRTIYTFLHSALHQDDNLVDKAFLYAQDIFCIITDLYGMDGRGKDEDNENVETFINILDKILAAETEKDRISKDHLERCRRNILSLPQAYMERYPRFRQTLKTIEHKIKVNEKIEKESKR